MKLSAAQRKIASEFVIGLSICGAAYYFLVQPLKRELIVLNTQTAEALASSPVTAPPDPAKVQSLLRSVREKADRILDNGKVARSEAEMFARLNGLAARYEVRIEELRSTAKSPLSPPSNTGPAIEPANSPNAPGPAATPLVPVLLKDFRVQYEFTARGSFANATAFIAAIEDELGYSVVRNVRIVPFAEGDTDVVTLSVRTEHFDFDLSALNALLGTGAVAAAPEPTGNAAPGGTQR